MTEPAAKQPIFEIRHLYVKEHSCKVPHSPDIYQDEWKPEVNMEMSAKHEKMKDSLYEVVLRLAITAKNNQRSAYVVEVHQAGIFKLEGFDEEQMKSLLSGYCPNQLYPYARKMIADITQAAGFQPLILSPVNFEALYMQQQQKASENTMAVTGESNKNTVPEEEEASYH